MKWILFCVVPGLLFVSYIPSSHSQTTASTSIPADYTIDPQAPIGSEKHPARVSSGIMFGNLVNRVWPAYPSAPPCGTPLPENWKGSGVTTLRVVINPEGKVDWLKIISGREAFRQPVLDAVHRWTYKPYFLNGQPVWVETIITLDVLMGC